MAIILNRIDTVPLTGESFTFEFTLWLYNLTDALNEIIQQIETELGSLDARLVAIGA
jgi:hypothetical protein